MKSIVCGKCFDVRALREGTSVRCSCGNVEGWWVDAQHGIAKVYAKERDRAKILGMHNGFITPAFQVYDLSPARWRELHETCTKNAEGYVFHTDIRNCPFALVPIGGTNDVTWSETPFDLAGSTPIPKLEDALEDAMELAVKLKGTAHEPLIMGLNIQIEHALASLGWKP